MLSYPRERFRDKRKTVVGTFVYDQYNRPAGCTTPLLWNTVSTGAPSVVSGEFETMTDRITPSFPKRSGRGDIIMSPMSRLAIRLDDGTGESARLRSLVPSCASPWTYYREARYTYGGGVTLGRALSGFYVLDAFNRPYPLGTANSVDRDKIIAEATTEALANRQNSSGNLYESLAEYQQALTLLPGMLNGLAHFCDTNVKVFAKARAAGNLYLLYRYGLKPLISDVETVVSGLSKEVGLMRVTSRGKSKFHSQKDTNYTQNLFGGAFMADVTLTIDSQIDVRAMSLDEYVVSLSENLALGAKQLMTVPWELIPYSFVIDWFLNVGTFLSAIAPTYNCRNLGSCYVVTEETQGRYAVVGASPASGYATITPPVCTNTLVQQRKTRIIGLPAPVLLIKGDFRLTSITRLLDAAALLLQKVPRLR